MKIEVKGHPLYAYTGGKPFNPEQPTAVFIHGVLNDHSVWILQSRWLAHHGWNVLAIDQSGHGRSGGAAPHSVADASATVIALLDALDIRQAALVGHSFGSLIALHTAAIAPERISHLVMVGTAFPMRVSPALLDTSLNQPDKAIAMVNAFSHSTLAPPPSALGPGTWLYGGSAALMRRVLASNATENVFHTGFVACDSYADGDADMVKVTCPVTFILGERDQMTPPKAAQSLVKAARAAGLRVDVATVPAGHSLMTEAPEETLAALRQALA